MKKRVYLPLLLFFIASWAVAQKPARTKKIINTIMLSFQNMVGNRLLQADTIYQNPFNEPFSVTQFKYYISNISFSDSNDREIKIPNSYFLVNEQDSASKSFTVSAAVSNISAIHFFIGVDSIRNVSGVQTGSLDPLNGMFWTWSTGYIMAKLEAVSSLSNAPQSRVTYHIGGFQNDNNVVKKISIPMPSVLHLKKETTYEILIKADINKWFAGANDIKIEGSNFCMNPGPLANKIASNYSSMFSLSEIIVH